MVTFENTISIADKIKKVSKTISKVNETTNKVAKCMKKNDTTYNKVEGKDLNKRIARQKISNAIIKSNVSGLMLSLTSNKNVDTEKAILNELPDMQIVAVENRINIVSDMRKMFKEHNLPIKVFIGNINQKLYGADKDTYAHLNLDYCSNILTIAKELKYVLENNIVKQNGIIAVTIYKIIRHSKQTEKGIFDKMGVSTSNFKGDYRNELDKSVERFFYALCGFNYSVELFEYRDTSSMVLALIKREY